MDKFRVVPRISLQEAARWLQGGGEDTLDPAELLKGLAILPTSPGRPAGTGVRRPAGGALLDGRSGRADEAREGAAPGKGGGAPERETARGDGEESGDDETGNGSEESVEESLTGAGGFRLDASGADAAKPGASAACEPGASSSDASASGASDRDASGDGRRDSGAGSGRAASDDRAQASRGGKPRVDGRDPGSVSGALANQPFKGPSAALLLRLFAPDVQSRSPGAAGGAEQPRPPEEAERTRAASSPVEASGPPGHGERDLPVSEASKSPHVGLIPAEASSGPALNACALGGVAAAAADASPRPGSSPSAACASPRPASSPSAAVASSQPSPPDHGLGARGAPARAAVVASSGPPPADAPAAPPRPALLPAPTASSRPTSPLAPATSHVSAPTPCSRPPPGAGAPLPRRSEPLHGGLLATGSRLSDEWSYSRPPFARPGAGRAEQAGGRVETEVKAEADVEAWLAGGTGSEEVASGRAGWRGKGNAHGGALVDRAGTHGAVGDDGALSGAAGGAVALSGAAGGAGALSDAVPGAEVLRAVSGAGAVPGAAHDPSTPAPLENASPASSSAPAPPPALSLASSPAPPPPHALPPAASSGPLQGRLLSPHAAAAAGARKAGLGARRSPSGPRLETDVEGGSERPCWSASGSAVARPSSSRFAPSAPPLAESVSGSALSERVRTRGMVASEPSVVVLLEPDAPIFVDLVASDSGNETGEGEGGDRGGATEKAREAERGAEAAAETAAETAEVQGAARPPRELAPLVGASPPPSARASPVLPASSASRGEAQGAAAARKGSGRHREASDGTSHGRRERAKRSKGGEKRRSRSAEGEEREEEEREEGESVGVAVGADEGEEAGSARKRRAKRRHRHKHHRHHKRHAAERVDGEREGEVGEGPGLAGPSAERGGGGEEANGEPAAGPIREAPGVGSPASGSVMAPSEVGEGAEEAAAADAAAEAAASASPPGALKRWSTPARRRRAASARPCSKKKQSRRSALFPGSERDADEDEASTGTSSEEVEEGDVAAFLKEVETEDEGEEQEDEEEEEEEEEDGDRWREGAVGEAAAGADGAARGGRKGTWRTVPSPPVAPTAAAEPWPLREPSPSNRALLSTPIESTLRAASSPGDRLASSPLSSLEDVRPPAPPLPPGPSVSGSSGPDSRCLSGDDNVRAMLSETGEARGAAELRRRERKRRRRVKVRERKKERRRETRRRWAKAEGAGDGDGADASSEEHADDRASTGASDAEDATRAQGAREGCGTADGSARGPKGSQRSPIPQEPYVPAPWAPLSALPPPRMWAAGSRSNASATADDPAVALAAPHAPLTARGRPAVLAALLPPTAFPAVTPQPWSWWAPIPAPQQDVASGSNADGAADGPLDASPRSDASAAGRAPASPQTPVPPPSSAPLFVATPPVRPSPDGSPAFVSTDGLIARSEDDRVAYDRATAGLELSDALLRAAARAVRAAAADPLGPAGRALAAPPWRSSLSWDRSAHQARINPAVLETLQQRCLLARLRRATHAHERADALGRRGARRVSLLVPKRVEGDDGERVGSGLRAERGDARSERQHRP